MNHGIFARLDRHDIKRLKNSAKQAEKIERTWKIKVKRYLDQYTREWARAKIEGLPEPKMELDRLFEEHYFDTMFKTFGVVVKEDAQDAKVRRLAKPPAPRIPKSLKTLRELYDEWRKGRYSPRRPKVIADRIQKEYLKRINSVWEKRSEEFREGRVFNQNQVVKEIAKEAAMPAARAQTTIQTETTNYYNEVRKDYYDRSPDVTHYLFLAVRDAATTAWCSAKTTNGKRGRHGLVYAKTDPLCEKEKPACHWNCRSEFLPLSPLNPAHLRLIQDASIQRRNHSCTPLPKGWAA